MEESLKPLTEHLKEFLSLINTPLFSISGSKISFMSLGLSLLIIILAAKIAKYVGKILNRTLEIRSVDSGVRDSLEKFVRYLIIVVGILFSMDNLGVSINSLAAVGAILMVGIGFGLQNITQNFISGLILLIERPIKVGDIVKVGDTSGKVLDIRVRSTVIQTRDNVTIIVPNSKFVAEDVTNESYLGEKVRHHIRVSVSYGSDVKMVQDTLCSAAHSNENVLKTPAPIVLLEDFGDSTLNFDLRFWCNDIWHIERISSDIRCEIDKLFREKNIEIPFPQRDLNFKFSQIEKIKNQLF
ncbi:MAG: mechanosensitive ion channel [Bdellovibrionaceae bacterium]|nr:mechanosensitive ion channel [Pseudobdellovibrionaceae bacterium]